MNATTPEPTTTDDRNRPIVDVYLDGFAESLGFQVNVARSRRDVAAAKIAEIAAKVAAGRPGALLSGFDHEAIVNYRTAAIILDLVESVQRFARDGIFLDGDAKEPTPRDERIDLLRDYYRQTVRSVLSFAEGGGGFDHEVRTQTLAALAKAIDEAEGSSFDSVARLLVGDALYSQHRSARNRVDALRTLRGRARSEDRIAALDAEIEEAEAAFARFEERLRDASGDARRSISALVGGRISGENYV